MKNLLKTILIIGIGVTGFSQSLSAYESSKTENKKVLLPYKIYTYETRMKKVERKFAGISYTMLVPYTAKVPHNVYKNVPVKTISKDIKSITEFDNNEKYSNNLSIKQGNQKNVSNNIIRHNDNYFSNN